MAEQRRVRGTGPSQNLRVRVKSASYGQLIKRIRDAGHTPSSYVRSLIAKDTGLNP